MTPNSALISAAKFNYIYNCMCEAPQSTYGNIMIVLPNKWLFAFETSVYLKSNANNMMYSRNHCFAANCIEKNNVFYLISLLKEHIVGSFTNYIVTIPSFNVDKPTYDGA